MTTWLPLPIDGYSCYEWCEKLGAVRSWKNNKWGRRSQPRILRPRRSAGGYYSWHLTNDHTGTQHNVALHVMVCTHYHGPRPAGMCVCHNDGNPENNHPANLRWDTPRANVLDSVRHGVRRIKLTNKDAATIRAAHGMPHAALARQFGVHASMVSRVRGGQRRREDSISLQ